MRYFVPELALGATLGPQREYQDKFGGLPWGLPPERWPLCAECGNPQTLLVQLRHDAKRLDLGAEGRYVLVFQCAFDPGMCDTWDADSGANAVLFMDATEMMVGLTSPPASDIFQEIEARVVSWEAREDTIPEERYPLFFDEPIDDDTLEFLERSYSGTKVGSVPTFMQSASEAPGPPFRFVAQFSYYHEFRGEPPAECIEGIPISRRRDAPGYTVAAANYGDAGTGYLFVNVSRETPDLFVDHPKGPPAGKFFWQCG
jgi:hypothetical protein